MKSAYQIAFLNLLFIIINCFWIIIVDDKKIYGLSIYDTFFTNWSYLTPHIATFNIWKVITIGLVLTGIFYCILLQKEEVEENALALQIQKSGNWMMLNQTLLGLSIIIKVNNYLVLAYLCSLGTFYSLVKLSLIFKIRDYNNPSFIHIFTRTSLGLYAGWFVYLLGFNGIPTLSRFTDFPPAHPIFFVIALLFIIGSYSYIWYKAMLCRLPAILLGYSAGILGSYYYNIQNNSESIHQLIIRYTLLVVLVVTIISLIYLLYQKRKSYLIQD